MQETVNASAGKPGLKGLASAALAAAAVADLELEAFARPKA